MIQKEADFMKDVIVSRQTDPVSLPAVALSRVDMDRTSQNFPSQAAQEKDAPRVHLGFLDGLRGLAALYVVLCHVWIAECTRWNARTGTQFEVDPGLPNWLHRAINLLNYGHYAVVIFIVLSGFCLMLPVVRSTEGTLKSGIFDYFKRRSLRILPPYYAALALSLLLIALVPGMHKIDGGWWNVCLPAFTPGVILSHLLLIHNLDIHWFVKIDGPMWSVASEWQIYFIFPLLLLPVWKRFGAVAAVAAGFVAAMVIHKGAHQHFDIACPWFIASFALGMAAASICFSRKSKELILRNQIPWGVLTLAAALGLGVVLRHLSWVQFHMCQVDMLASVCAACFLVFCTQCASRGFIPNGSWIVRLLEARWPQQLGAFSYSLYLTHFPVLGLMDLCFHRFHTTPVVHLMLMIFVAVPVCVLAAYGFYLAVERHFIPSRSNQQSQPNKFHALKGLFSASTNSTAPAALLPFTMSAKSKLPRVHLGFLDGLRGLAVLYVLFYHARLTRLPELPQAGIKGLLTNWLLYGHLAVDVFIVLSGFCLMLPVARRGELTGGAVQFFKKRARRILPPFWAACAFGVVVNAFTAKMLPHGHLILTPVKTLLTNMLLLQDIHPACNNINGAFWSVAAEWKIYFLFPLLVWVGCRYGAKAALTAAVGIGFALTGALYLTHRLYLVSDHGHVGLTLTCPWYVALFGLGMYASSRVFGLDSVKQFDGKWKLGGLASVALLLGILAAFPHKGDNVIFMMHWPLIDAAAGLVTALGLLWLGVKSRNGETHLLLRALSWRPLVFMGSMGYSLYLIHLPVLYVYMAIMCLPAFHALSGITKDLCLVGFMLPLIVAVAYVFFLAFERPFLSQSPNSSRQKNSVPARPLALIYALLHISG